MERTLVLAKPDAVQRGLVGEIVARLERKGLKLIGLKMMSADEALLDAHYAHITDKPFYSDIKEFMSGSPLVAMAWEGYECTNAVRKLVGPTNAREASGGTIRGDYAMAPGRNLVHASDSKENGREEVDRFFTENELFDYDKTEYVHIYDSRELSE